MMKKILGMFVVFMSALLFAPAAQAAPGDSNYSYGDRICNASPQLSNGCRGWGIPVKPENYNRYNQVAAYRIGSNPATYTSLYSNNGRYRAYMNLSTCRLTVENRTNGSVVWSSPNGRGCYNVDIRQTAAYLQSDGNFVVYVYNTDLSFSGGVAAWASGTQTCAGSFNSEVVMQDDGNLVMYQKNTREVFWSSRYGKSACAR